LVACISDVHVQFEIIMPTVVIVPFRITVLFLTIATTATLIPVRMSINRAVETI